MAKKPSSEIQIFHASLAELKARLLAARKKDGNSLRQMKFPDEFVGIPCGRPGEPIDLFASKDETGELVDDSHFEKALRAIDFKGLEKELIAAQAACGPNTAKGLAQKHTLQKAYMDFFTGVRNLESGLPWDYAVKEKVTTGRAAAVPGRRGKKANASRVEGAISFMNDWEQSKAYESWKKYCKRCGISVVEGNRLRELVRYQKKKSG